MRGERWRARILTEQKFKDEHPEHPDAGALTICAERRIDFNADDFSLGAVLHELTHAYFVYIPVDTTKQIAASDFEEIFASFLESSGEELFQTAKKIEAKLKNAAAYYRN